jgi:hypothetical protein
MASSSSPELLYRLAADAVLAVHVAFVGFVVIGLVLVLVGAVLGWRWVRSPVFRGLHLVAIGYVVLESWFGVRCPLTVWEMALRARAGDVTYGGDFIQHWLQAVLYYDAPTWVFTVAYTAFGLLVVASWFLVPPRRRQPSSSDQRSKATSSDASAASSCARSAGTASGSSR